MALVAATWARADSDTMLGVLRQVCMRISPGTDRAFREETGAMVITSWDVFHALADGLRLRLAGPDPRNLAYRRFEELLAAGMTALVPAEASAPAATEAEPAAWRPRCAYCGEPFTAKRLSAKYCSPSHRTLAYQHRLGVR